MFNNQKSESSVRWNTKDQREIYRCCKRESAKSACLCVYIPYTICCSTEQSRKRTLQQKKRFNFSFQIMMAVLNFEIRANKKRNMQIIRLALTLLCNIPAIEHFIKLENSYFSPPPPFHWHIDFNVEKFLKYLIFFLFFLFVADGEMNNTTDRTYNNSMHSNRMNFNNVQCA